MHSIKLLLSILLLISNFSQPLFSGAIEVSPTKIFFSPEQKFTFITIKNIAKEKTYVQAELFKWEQEKGKDIYTLKNDLIISPPFFAIDAQSEQVVRVGRRVIDNYDYEQSYRLILSEIPDQFNKKTGLQILLRLSLPIFITPQTASDLQLQWSKKSTNKNSVELSIYNPNNTHKMVQKIELKNKLNENLYEKQNAFIYLLPKQKYTWTISDNKNIKKSKNMASIKSTKNNSNNKSDNNSSDNIVSNYLKNNKLTDISLVLETNSGKQQAIAMNNSSSLAINKSKLNKLRKEITVQDKNPSKINKEQS